MNDVITGSIACSEKRRYLCYPEPPEGNFEVFSFLPHMGRSVALMGDGVKFGVHRYNDKATDPKTENFTKILLNFGI